MTFFAALLWLAPVHAAGLSAFGPRDFVRSNGKPVAETFRFAETPGYRYTLRLVNWGSGRQYAPVTAAVVLLNGQTVFGPNDFNPGVDTLSKDVVLQADNRLSVELRGKPGSGFTLTVAGTRPNQAPRITSTPPLTARVGEAYAYQPAASDADGDALGFRLTGAPAGMSVDARTGAIAWTPGESQVGGHALTLTVEEARSDGEPALSDAQSFTVNVVQPNRAPRITSTPGLAALIGSAYAYTVQAGDADGDTLAYSLAAAPAGMAIDARTGVIAWTPGAGQEGEHAVTVRVEEAAARPGEPRLADSQGYRLTVTNPNRAPVFTSTAPTAGETGKTFSYDAEAGDADGDRVSFRLLGAPEGMDVRADTGYVYWHPSTGQAGDHPVALEADDGRGGKTVQEFTLRIAPQANRAPAITSAPVLAAGVEQAYAYDVEARDADGDALAYTLVQAPQGMSMDPATGLIAWTPSAAQRGRFDVTLRVSDGKGGEAEQVYALTVAANNHAPQITSPAVTEGREGELYRYEVQARDADEGDVLRYGLKQGPEGMSIDAGTGAIQWLPSAQFVESLADVNPLCRLPKADPGKFEPVVKWQWNTTASVLSVPLVAPLKDSNGDGKVNTDDAAYVIFVSHEGDVDGSIGQLRVMEGKTGKELWSHKFAELPSDGSAHPAVGDIDGDGVPEIVMYLHWGGGVAAVNADGSLKWQSPEPGRASKIYNYGSISLADLDGDGRSEILARNAVLNYDGSLRWRVANKYGHVVSSIAVDLDLDGQQEVIVGPDAYTSVGTLLWTTAGTPHYVAVGQFDSDAHPELVMVSSRALTIVEHTGQVAKSIPLSAYNGGSPTVADMDGDGLPEIGLNDEQNAYTVYKPNGSILWRPSFVSP